jgi:hypothetical protein
MAMFTRQYTPSCSPINASIVTSTMAQNLRAAMSVSALNGIVAGHMLGL